MARPNVLWITTDQQHFETLGVVNDEVDTPNLDRLCEQGTLFDRAYCPNPTCTPSRASMITGTMPSQHGAYSLGTKLDEDEHTVGEDFQTAGYRTDLVGKAHFQPLDSTEEFESLEAYPTLQDLEFWRDFHGPFYGFEHVELARNHVDEAHVGQHYAIWMEEQGFEDWRDCFQQPTGTSEPQHGAWNIPEEYHYNTWIAERTNARLERHAESDEPFFTWASFFDPHPPYAVPEPWASMYDPEDVTVPSKVPGEHDANPPHFQETQQETPDFPQKEGEHGALHGLHSHVQDEADLAEDIAIYYGMVSMLDYYVGEILDRLEELGLADDTVVVFTSDHGHLYGQHGMTAKGPFHYEDLLRVPTIVRYPGEVPAGRRCSALQSLEDLAPTMLSLCDIDDPHGMTGVDQSAVWRGERDAARDHVLVENNHDPGTVYAQTYVGERYKLTMYQDESYGELFDLESDPGETNNLWDSPEHATLKTDLLLELLSAKMDAESIPMPRIAVA
jgi:uncharacterized sulfatase